MTQRKTDVRKIKVPIKKFGIKFSAKQDTLRTGKH